MEQLLSAECEEARFALEGNEKFPAPIGEEQFVRAQHGSGRSNSASEPLALGRRSLPAGGQTPIGHSGAVLAFELGRVGGERLQNGGRK